MCFLVGGGGGVMGNRIELRLLLVLVLRLIESGLIMGVVFS